MSRKNKIQGQIKIPRYALVFSRLSLLISKNKTFLLILFSSLFFLFVLLFFYPSPLKRLDFWAYDWNIKKRSLSSPQVVILAIDEYCLQKLGPWPWPREIYARVLKLLHQAQAKVVVFDLVFSPPKAGDEVLAKAMKEQKSVLAAYTEDVLGRSLAERGILVSRIILPAPILQENAYEMGHIGLIYDEDGIVRRVPAFLADQRISLPALGIATMWALKGKKGVRVYFSPAAVDLGFRLPLNPDGSFYIGYFGGRGTFPTVRILDLLQKEVPLEIFRDKIVLIGVTAVGISDEWPTPFIEEGSMSGVEIHANIIESILEDRVPWSLPLWTRFPLALFLFGLCFWFVRPLSKIRIIFFVLLPWSYFIGASFSFLRFNLFLSPSPLLSGWLLGTLAGIGQQWWSLRKERLKEIQIYKETLKLFQNFSFSSWISHLRERFEAQVVGVYLVGEEVFEKWETSPLLPVTQGERKELFLSLLEKEAKGAGRYLFSQPIDEETTLYLLLIFPHRSLEGLSEEISLAAAIWRARRSAMVLQQAEEETIESFLRYLRERRPELYEHSLRVAEICTQLAEALGLSQEEKKNLYWAAMLHDFALLDLPPQKPWPELHPLIAADIFGTVSFLRKAVLYIRHHHERFDGQGYPDGLRGEEIPLGARILGLAEGFVEFWEQFEQEGDDLLRLEEKIWSALRKEAGKRFDPNLINLLRER